MQQSRLKLTVPIAREAFAAIDTLIGSQNFRDKPFLLLPEDLELYWLKLHNVQTVLDEVAKYED